MIRTLGLLNAGLLLILQLAGGKCLAQTAVEEISEDRTIHRAANVNLGLVSGGSQPATLEAIYRSGSGTYALWFDDKKTDSINLISPLDLRYFRSKVNAMFNKAFGHTGTDVKTLTEQSVMGMFYLLYTMKAGLDDDPPPAGDLYLHRHVMVFKNASEAEKMDMDDRERKLGQVDDAISALRNSLNVADSMVIQAINVKMKEAMIQTGFVGILSLMTLRCNKENSERIASALANIREHFRDVGYDVSTDIAALGSAAELKKRLNAYTIASQALSDGSQKFQSDKIFSIRRITFKVERGFLEDIHVEVENDHGTTDWYDNVVPIGMSSMGNLKNFGLQRLFIRKPGGFDHCIYLTDVLGNYDLWEELLTRDYAPGDTTINRIDPNRFPYITLRREHFVHLFDSRIYTDLAGLDDKTPNGLVQIEVSRRFNFLTNRFQHGGKRGDWGALNYIFLYGALTKIEDKLKRLPLQNAYVVQNNTIVSPNYVTNLNLRQWENASLGLDLNVLLNNWKDGKTVFSFDLGARYGRTPVIDSLQRLDATGQLVFPTINDDLRLTAHTITWFPRLKLEFISQRRVGFTLAYQWNHTLLFSNNRFKQIASEQKSDLASLATERQARRSHQIDLDVRVLTSRTGADHLFFRGRFYLQQGDASTFFPQFQLGYNYNLVFKR